MKARKTQARKRIAADNEPTKFAAASRPPKAMFTEKIYDRFVGNHLMRIEDPDLILQQAGLTRDLLRRLETDDEIFGALETRLGAILETPWRLEGATGDQGAPFEFIWEQLEPCLEEIITGAFQAVPYGYSVLEGDYLKWPDGRVTLKSCGIRPLQYFEPQRDGSLVYLNPQTGSRDLQVQEGQLFLTRNGATWENPYGQALLSRLYWAWVFRVGGWELWAKYVDRHGDPMMVGKSRNPKGLVDALTEVGFFNVIGIGQNDEVEISSQGGSEVFEAFERVLVGRIQKLVLGQTLTTDNANGGSNALGKVHAETKNTKRNDDIRMVTRTVQQVVNALWKFNNFSGKAPKFVMGDGKGIEKERADRDAVLFKLGVKPTEQYIMRVYDFEKGDVVVRDPEEEPEIDPADPSGTKPNDNEDIDDEGTSETKPSKTKKPKAKKPAGKFAAAGFTKAQQEVEDAGAGADVSMLEPFDTAVLREVVFAATDAQDLADRLSVAMGDVDPEEFQAALGQALFTARVLGYVAAAKEA